MTTAYELLTIKQLDKKLGPLRSYFHFMSNRGWIFYIRNALEISTGNLAKLMGIKQPSVVAMEQREADNTITLETLEKAANAMGCDLFYAFVPKDSFEKFVDSKRRELVNRIITETNLTMSLEEQGLSKKEIAEQANLLMDDLRIKPLKQLWRDL